MALFRLARPWRIGSARARSWESNGIDGRDRQEVEAEESHGIRTGGQVLRLCRTGPYGSGVSRRSPASRRHALGRTRRVRRAVAALVLAGGLGALPPGVAVAAPSDPVTFADPVFRTCVAAALGMRPSSPITAGQAASLTSLDCGELSPASLDGAEAPGCTTTYGSSPTRSRTSSAVIAVTLSIEPRVERP